MTKAASFADRRIDTVTSQHPDGDESEGIGA